MVPKLSYPVLIGRDFPGFGNLFLMESSEESSNPGTDTMAPANSPPLAFSELAQDLFSVPGKSRKSRKERRADIGPGTKVLAQNQKVVLVGKQSYPAGKEATWITGKPETGPSSTETNPGAKWK